MAAYGQSVANFIASNPNLLTSDFQLPILAIRESALTHNINRMAQYCKDKKILLAPHSKTSMSPQIAKRQIEAGAWGITVANFYQANIFLEYGFNKIIIANEILEPTVIREIARLNSEENTKIYFYIDSLPGLRIIQEAIDDVASVKLNILVEIGTESGRAGVRNLDLLTSLMVEISKEPRITVHGVSGFEGIVPDSDREAGAIQVRKFLKEVVAAAKIVQPFVKNKIIITAGGSSFFDYVEEEFAEFDGESEIILRSGGYVSHDHIHYENLNPFMNMQSLDQFIPALELWSQVLSIPDPKLAILNFGKRDAGNDLDNPVPIKKFSMNQALVSEFKGVINKLNDQHAFMSISERTLEIGQKVGLGISHPCTNFDKWRLIPLVDDNYDVKDCIFTQF